MGDPVSRPRNQEDGLVTPEQAETLQVEMWQALPPEERKRI
jgi:hypothetical protein